MNYELQDKVAVVTGASQGIGYAIVRALFDEGARIVGGARHTGRLAELDGDRVLSVAVDLATPRGPGELVSRALERFGRVDLLVNNVGGTDPRVKGFLSVTDEQWLHSYEFNVMTAVRASRAALPGMLEQGGGSIVNIASLNSRLPRPAAVDYSAAKAALMNLTKALSEEFAPRGVRVNSVLPGPVRTPLWTGKARFGDRMATAMGIELTEWLDKKLPDTIGMTLGRMVEPEEIAAVVVMLSSARGSAITGADFIVDCGMNKSL